MDVILKLFNGCGVGTFLLTHIVLQPNTSLHRDSPKLAALSRGTDPARERIQISS